MDTIRWIVCSNCARGVQTLDSAWTVFGCKKFLQKLWLLVMLRPTSALSRPVMPISAGTCRQTINDNLSTRLRQAAVGVDAVR